MATPAEDLEAAVVFLRQLCAAGAYGKLELTLQNGGVTHVSLDQSWKPSQLPELPLLAQELTRK